MVTLAIAIAVGGLVSLGAIWFTNKQINTAKELIEWFVPHYSFTYSVIIFVIITFMYFASKGKTKRVSSFLLIPLCVLIIGLEKTVMRDLKIDQKLVKSRKYEMEQDRKRKENAGKESLIYKIPGVHFISAFFTDVKNREKEYVKKVYGKKKKEKKKEAEKGKYEEKPKKEKSKYETSEDR